MELRITVLGGTRFIGRAIVEELLQAGHNVQLVHRGQTEPDDLSHVEHVHLDRHVAGALGAVRATLEAFKPDAVLDCMAFDARDSDEALGVFARDDLRLLVLSSVDTYRAYGGLHHNIQTDPLPLDETSPVRSERYLYRGAIPGMDNYEKLDVEERWLARGATVLRLPITFGPRDGQRREEFILRRLRSGRTRIPIGSANGLLTHGYVGDIAVGARLALEADAKLVGGEVFNLGEERTPPVGLRAQWIIEAAGMADQVELVPVPDNVLPADLALTGAVQQHLLVQSNKARGVLGWTTIDPREALRTSVEWHLANPPQSDEDFSEDDQALEHRIVEDSSS